jgi:hypothetical protein
MAKQTTEIFSEKIMLRSDNGSELFFRGRLFSEISQYDEESGMIIRLRLFETDQGEQVYSIISGSGADKRRRHYIVAQEGEFYRLSDGIQTMRLPLELLFASVFGLCGIDPARADAIKPAFEEGLRLSAS